MRDRAVAAASPHAERRALELAAVVVLALIELRLQERHTVGVDLQEVALAGRGFERLTQDVELSVEERDVVTAGFLRRAELLFALAQGAGCGFLRGAMAGGLRGELRLAFGDDDVESRPFGGVLARHDLERLERGADLIQSVPHLLGFGRDAPEFRVARQPLLFMRRSLPLDRVVQTVQLILRRAERLPQCLRIELDVTDHVGSLGDRLQVLGAFLLALCRDLGLVFAGPPPDAEHPGEKPASRLRGLEASLRQIAFDRPAIRDFLPEIGLDRFAPRGRSREIGRGAQLCLTV